MVAGGRRGREGDERQATESTRSIPGLASDSIRFTGVQVELARRADELNFR